MDESYAPTPLNVSHAMKELILVGANFRTAAACERTHLALSSDQARELHASIAKEITAAEFCMVSTCNRAEFFLFAPPGVDTLAALYAVIGCHCPHFEELRRNGQIIHKQGIDAYAHLLRVTCGLESMVLGDTQIVQQVRQALQLARDASTTGVYLEQAFGRALSLGSRVRSESNISSGSPGVAAAICDTIASRQPSVGAKPKRVLLIGAGTISTGVARMLASRGTQHLLITNRSLEKAAALAEECSGTALPWSDLATACSDADVVVAATSSSQPVVTVAMLDAVRTDLSRGARKLMIDAGMPPNIETYPAGPFEIVGIDSIREQQDQQLNRRREAIPHVERCVQHELALWTKWSAQRPLENVLKSLYLDLADVPDRLAGRFSESWHSASEDVHYIIHRELKQLLHPHVRELRRIVFDNPMKNALTTEKGFEG